MIRDATDADLAGILEIYNDVILSSTAVYTDDPVPLSERRQWLESAKPITIGSDVWVGGGAIICPGVTIGDRSVIGAGSVVTRDIPSDVLASGNPARVIRALPPEAPEEV